jgi:hypothetical protein
MTLSLCDAIAHAVFFSPNTRRRVFNSANRSRARSGVNGPAKICAPQWGQRPSNCSASVTAPWHAPHRWNRVYNSRADRSVFVCRVLMLTYLNVLPSVIYIVAPTAPSTTST